jgi:hypothetical protein
MFESRISTVIPVLIKDNENLIELKNALISLEKQTLRPDEVIISANILDIVLHAEMLKLTKSFSLNIIVHINSLGMNPQANTNNGVKYVKNEIVHILHHDDSIIEEFAYEKIAYAFLNENIIWAILNLVEKDGIKFPKVQPGLIWGFNSIGGPSVLVTRKEWYIPFSTDYAFLWDCVNFHNYNTKYGEPLFFENLHIRHGTSENRLSNLINLEKRLGDFLRLKAEGYATPRGLMYLILRPNYWTSHLKFILKSVSGDTSWAPYVRILSAFFSVTIYGLPSLAKRVLRRTVNPPTGLD